MDKKLTFVLIMTFFAFTAYAQGIQFFEGSWKDALKKAKSEDKIVFVDAYAKWCGPCKSMAKNVFTKDEVGAFYNANFINLKLDMEEADGVSFGHKYPVSAYPTLFFLDGEGKVIKTVKGGQSVESLIQVGVDATKKNDKSLKFEEKYLAGDRSYDLMLGYVKALNAAGKPSLKISNEYLQSNPDISENKKLIFIFEAATEADSKLFDQLLEQKSKVIDLVGKKEFEEKSKAACKVSAQKAVDYEMESLLQETTEKAKKAFPNQADEFIFTSNLVFYGSVKNEPQYRESYKNLAKLNSKNVGTLRYIIKNITKQFPNNNNMLRDASDYAEKIYDEEKNIENLNLYCSILLQCKEIDKALKIANEARSEAEKKGENLDQLDRMIQYLNSKK